MAMRRPVKFFIGFIVLFFVVGVLALAGAWMMMLRGPSVPDHATLILRIGGDLVETAPNDVLGQVTGGAKAQTVRGYVDALRRAKDDPRIESVLIVPSPFESPFWGKVQEIRDAVIDFQKSGKRISAFLEYAGEREYYLATAADRIYLLPTSSARCDRHGHLRSVPEGHARQDRRAGRFREDRRLQDRAQSAHPDDVHARASRDDASRSPATCTTSSCAASPRRAGNKWRTCAR